MNSIISKTYLTLISIISLAMMAACTSDAPSPEGSADREAVLSIRLHLNDAPGQRASRAANADFEDAQNPYEAGVRTLRIIIAAPARDMEVEYNHLYSLEDINCNLEDMEPLRYKVKAGENKRIFFVANEYLLPEDTRALLASPQRGAALSPEILDIILSESASGWLVDNAGAKKSFLPMSESFDFNIPAPAGASDEEYAAEFFLTRATSTFRFSIGDVADTYLAGFRVKSITVSDIASSEYLFPHATVYSPGKYEASSRPLGGREIISFASPSPVATRSFTFIPANFGYNGRDFSGLSSSFVPLKYFCESPAPPSGQFFITLLIEVGGVEIKCGPAPLPNLPQLPRNTIVDVQFAFDSSDITLSTTLVPYYEVTLMPEFGFDDIIYHPDSYN